MLFDLLMLSLALNAWLIFRLKRKHLLLKSRTAERDVWLKRGIKWGHGIKNWKIPDWASKL